MIKTFVINLPSQSQKKKNVSSFCRDAHLDFEIITAADGEKLTKEQCWNYIQFPNNFLTPGEIGCLLSHLHIYQKIISQRIDHALILEDDIKLFDLRNFNQIIEHAVLSVKENHIILLNEGITGLPISKIYDNYKICKYVSGNGSFGYLIDNKAAHELFKMQLPIRFETDFWKAIFYSSSIGIYNLIPALVVNADPAQIFSTIEPMRKVSRSKRSLMQSKLFKQECKTIRYKVWNNIIFKLLRPFFKVS